MQELNDLSPNSPTLLPPISIDPPPNQVLETDPRFNSQPNEIFSFRGDIPRINHPILQNNQISNFSSGNEEHKDDDNDEDLEEVSHLLLKMVKSNLVFQILFLLFLAHLLWDIDIKIILALSWVNDSINCFLCLERMWEIKRKTTCCLVSKLKLKLFDNFVLISFKVLILLFIINPDFPISYGIFLLISQCITQISYMSYLKFYHKRPILSESIEFGFRFFVLIQTLMISLNLQGILHWLWKDIFWCFWVIFSILTGATLGFALIFLGKIYQKCFEKVDNFEIKGLFWLFSTTAGITVNSAISVTEITEFLDENGKNIEDLHNSFFGILAYFVSMLFYCIFFQRDLIKFLEKIGADDEEVDENHEEPHITIEDPKKMGLKKLKTEKNPSKYFFPSFLKKTSSTYFKAVNSSILHTVSSSLKRPKPHSKSNSKSNSFVIVHPNQHHKAKVTITNPKNDDKSPISAINIQKPNTSSISENQGKNMNNNFDLHNVSDPGQKNPTVPSGPTEENSGKFNRKNSNITGSNPDQSITCCLICFENSPDSVFMDCGHGGVCYNCATDIFKKTGECYLCRRAIKQVLLLDLKSKDGNFIKVKASTRMVGANEEHNETNNSDKFYIS